MFLRLHNNSMKVAVNFALYFLFVSLAFCDPPCTETTDTCVRYEPQLALFDPLYICKCGIYDPCGEDILTNRCLNSECVCGVSPPCTPGTRYAVCLDKLGATPGSSGSLSESATCKVSFIQKKSSVTNVVLYNLLIFTSFA